MLDWFDAMRLGPPLWHPDGHGVHLEAPMSVSTSALPVVLQALDLLVTLEANVPMAIALAQSIGAILRDGPATEADEAAIQVLRTRMRAAIDAP